MHRKSFFKIKLDLKRSRGSFLYDAGRDQTVLDLFGLYSSLPLGYNHPVFDDPAFKNEILEWASVKIPNNEMITEAGDKFLAAFAGHPSMKPFSLFHFNCTGALAIETALKAARDYRGSKNPKLISFKGSFHGINSYGGFITDRTGGAAARLEDLPGPFSDQLPCPIGDDAALRTRVLSMIEDKLKADTARDYVGVLVEPIQCTAGDYVVDPKFLSELRQLCTTYDTPLIFDEVQTGFGGTGTFWYFEQLGFVPDIVAFGKKAQTSGIMVQEKFGAIFKRPVRLEVTWDGDVIDMIRSRTILEAYARFNILANVKKQGEKFFSELKAMPRIKNVRHVGMLIAFDFDAKDERDAFVQNLHKNLAICSSTQEKTVRFRPHLAMPDVDVALALEKTRQALGAIPAMAAGR